MKGLFIGNSHAEGGIPSEIVETNRQIEIEGDEYYICSEAYNSDKNFTFKGKTNKQVLDQLYEEFSCKLIQSKMNAGDFIVCKLVVKDNIRHDRKGTVKSIVNEMQGEKSCKVENQSSFMSKGGEIIWTDTSVPQSKENSLKIWESYVGKNPMVKNQKAVGSFAHTYKGKYVGDYYLFLLDDYDRQFYSHVPLKPNEWLFRIETPKNRYGNPLVKINFKKGWVYFMSDDHDLNSDEDDKNPKFNKKSSDVVYISLNKDILSLGKNGINYALWFEKGGSVKESRWFSGDLELLNW